MPKVFLQMIGVPNGGICGSHSKSTSPRFSAHSRDHHSCMFLHYVPMQPFSYLPSQMTDTR